MPSSSASAFGPNPRRLTLHSARAWTSGSITSFTTPSTISRQPWKASWSPRSRKKSLGRAEVRQTFHVSKVGTIAGCYVLDGVITRQADGVRVIRDNVLVYEGKLHSLKRFKDDVREVQAGYECGLGVENFNDIKVGDIVEAYVIERVATKL